MKLSIIVPVFNMAADGKLEYCIKSLLNQNLTDYEIIAVDDASKDDSLEILRKFEKEYTEKIRVIASSENHHQGGARNIGIKASEAEFIGMMDSDDWAAPDMYVKLLKKAEETGADVVGCDYCLINEHTMEPGKQIAVNDEKQTGILTIDKKRLCVLKPGSMVVKIYKRSIITQNALWFPEDIFYEDNCMSPLWLLHCSHFERVAEPLYYYYQHDNSTVHVISTKRLHDRMEAMELMVKKSKEYGLLEEYKEEFTFRFAELYLVNTLFGLMGSKTKRKGVIVRQLRKGIKRYFPNFKENLYYKERIGAEEQKMISILMRSAFLFIYYYKILWCYRRIIDRMRGQH